MAPAERLRQLPGYIAFNAGVMFFIGLASKLTAETGAAIAPEAERVMGFGILFAVLAMAAGFASVARIEFAKRSGKRFSVLWIAPSVAIGLPLGRAIVEGRLEGVALAGPAVGLAAAAAGAAWLAIRARQEIQA